VNHTLTPYYKRIIQRQLDTGAFQKSSVGWHQILCDVADLTEEYVDFNKGDVTDASSLSG
jgi:hypothetical protein